MALRSITEGWELLRRFTPDREGSVLTLSAVMREAQKGERLRFSLAALLPVQGGEPPKLDQPRQRWQPFGRLQLSSRESVFAADARLQRQPSVGP